MARIVRRYEMEVAHQLTAGVPEGHKCRRPHGHRYVLEVEIEGPLDDDGILIEYGDIDRVVVPILKHVDHHSLNTLRERCSTREAELVSTNPTAERLVEWLSVRLDLLSSTGAAGKKARLSSLRLEEDSRSAVAWP